MLMSQPQPTQVRDPKALDTPVIMEQYTLQAGLLTSVEARRRGSTPANRTSTADSDYSSSGESEVEEEQPREARPQEGGEGGGVEDRSRPFWCPVENCNKSRTNVRRFHFISYYHHVYDMYCVSSDTPSYALLGVTRHGTLSRCNAFLIYEIVCAPTDEVLQPRHNSTRDFATHRWYFTTLAPEHISVWGC